MMNRLTTALVVLALTSPIAAQAQQQLADADAIRAMRDELHALKAAYESRINALEAQVRALQGTNVPGSGPNTLNASDATTHVSANPEVVATANPAPNVSNPNVSLILSGAYGRSSQNPDDYRISGVPLPNGVEAGPGFRGFSLGETELSLSANIDPWLRGVVHLAFAADNSVGVEEAYAQTTRLGQGLGLKAGRFYSGVGYLNQQHRHYWDFIDAPLAYQAMLGGQLGDDGLQLRWIAPTDLMVELGAEIGRGRAFPGGDGNRNGAGMTSVYAHLGGDLGESHSWRAGLSLLQARAGDQSFSLDALTSDASAIFSGTTRLVIGDFVWKWAPNGDSSRTAFKLQGEYIHARREGELALPELSNNIGASQSGWYLQGLYQFMPHWRIGLRADQLDPGSWASTLAPGFAIYRPQRASAILEHSLSEFSRLRLQFAQDRARRDLVDNQLILQYQVLLGSHPAHAY